MLDAAVSGLSERFRPWLSRPFEDLAIYHNRTVMFKDGDVADRLSGAQVTGSFFDILEMVLPFSAGRSE